MERQGREEGQQERGQRRPGKLSSGLRGTLPRGLDPILLGCSGLKRSLLAVNWSHPPHCPCPFSRRETREMLRVFETLRTTARSWGRIPSSPEGPLNLHVLRLTRRRVSGSAGTLPSPGPRGGQAGRVRGAASQPCLEMPRGRRAVRLGDGRTGPERSVHTASLEASSPSARRERGPAMHSGLATPILGLVEARGGGVQAVTLRSLCTGPSAQLSFGLGLSASKTRAKQKAFYL